MREFALLAVVLLLTAVALSPLLRADQPCTHDGGLHYYRIVAMRYALEDGSLFSRWVPDLAFGYGYPFFNYRAAVSYYLGLALYLTGLSLPQALNMVYALSIVAAAVGAYLIGRDIFGPAAGVVTAVAYVYAPYVFIDALVRGNMPESVALALFPYILWSFRRLLLSRKARYLLLSAATLALLWLSHNISSLLFTPLLVLYVLVVWLARGRRDPLALPAAALALGVGLTAFFWAPAVLEQRDVQLHLSRTTRNNDYHYNFVNLSEVLAPPAASDPALLNPPLRLPLGLGLASLASLGAALSVWRWRGSAGPDQDELSGDDCARVTELRRRERWVSAIFFALSGLVLIFMSTRASLIIWESLPLIAFVQFPWRFVGRAVLPLSLLAGAFVAALTPDPESGTREPGHGTRLSWLAALVAVGVLILVALPFTYPATGYCPAQARPDIRDVFAYEHFTGLVGVDPEGSYFPVTVRKRPASSSLEAQYAAILSEADQGQRPPVARFDQGSLPQGAVIHAAEYAPNRARLNIETPTAARARYLAFAFPGWRVRIDGQQTDIIPSDPEGLVTFDLPAGRHVVEVEWGSTPVRSIATIVSFLALAGLGLVALVATRARWVDRTRSDSALEPEAPSELAAPFPPRNQTSEKMVHSGPILNKRTVPWGAVALLALLGVSLFAFKILVVDRSDTFFRRPGLSGGGTLPDVDVPLDVRFADGVRLLGYEQSVDSMPADGTLHLALYWSAYDRPNADYRSTVGLIDTDGQLWSSKTAFPRRGYADLPPSPAWGDGRYAVEGFDVEPLPGTPPGRYELLLTTFDRETLAPLNVLTEAGQVAGPNRVIGDLELTRPSKRIGRGDLSVGTRQGAQLGPLVLEGANLDRNQAAPGDPMMVTLFWRVPDGAAGGSLPDLQAHLALVDGGGVEMMGWELPPVRSDWPTTLWRPGDLWRGQHLLRLPGGLEGGDYAWQLQLFDAADRQAPLSVVPIVLGELQVDAPQREWQAPPLELALDADLGGEVRLLGANLEPVALEAPTLQAGEILTVTLAWQGLQEMDTSYRVFLHLQRPDGSLLAQSDGEPAGWRRPTTGWAPGEVVLDQRSLEIPAEAVAGRYTLMTGLYDLGSGQRLALPDGTTAVLLSPVTIETP